MVKNPFGWVRRWAQKKIERELNITRSEFAIEKIIGDLVQTQITTYIWSSYPLKLIPERIIGTLRTADFETELKWDKKGKGVHKHVISDMNMNENAWLFAVNIPTETTRKYSTVYWHLSFVVYFQKDYCKTFEDVKLKLRESDIERIEKS